MGLFSGLEAFGFQNSDLKIYSDDSEKEKLEQKETAQQETKIREEDCLFPKTYKCPVCDKKKQNSSIRMD